MKRLSKHEMQIIYAQEYTNIKNKKSIFLAGPTSRKDGITKWRIDAINIFKDYNYDGVLFVPEIRNGIFNKKYEEQVKWETEMLNKSDVIMFWIDRQYSEGFTTNIEWGMYCKSNRIVVGFPNDSEKNRYIEMQCETYLNLDIKRSLEDTIKNAIKMVASE